MVAHGCTVVVISLVGLYTTFNIVEAMLIRRSTKSASRRLGWWVPQAGNPAGPFTLASIVPFASRTPRVR